MKNITHIKHTFFQYISSIDWFLFTFLILFLNVSIKLKILALLIAFIRKPNLKFNFRENRLPAFYLVIIGFSIVQMLLKHQLWSKEYFTLAGLGIAFWTISLLALHQLKLFIERNNTQQIHKTLVLFFIVNAVLSFYNLFQIMMETEVLNPYTYTGMGEKYGISAGDYISGLFFSHSIVNMFVNLLGCFYFLYNRQLFLSVLCLIISLLTTSNVGIIISLVLLIGLLFGNNKLNKQIALCFIGIIIVFYAKVSPENANYLTKKVQVTDESGILKTQDEKLAIIDNEKKNREEEIKAYLKKKEEEHITNSNGSSLIPDASNKENEVIQPNDDNPSETVIEEVLADHPLKDSLDIKKEVKALSQEKRNRPATEGFTESITNQHDYLIQCVKDVYGDSLYKSNNFTSREYPGKLLSFIETIKYNTSGTKEFLLGSGAGRFSSKLAFGVSGFTTGENNSKRFVNKFVQYISPEFKENHLAIYSFYWLQGVEKHSVINNPAASINQLAGEYGFIGVILFLIFYLWFFVKRYKKLTYGKLLLPLFLIMLFTDYWFEDLSVIILFELMMLIDIHKNNHLTTNN